jgi:hypothetical protein
MVAPGVILFSFFLSFFSLKRERDSYELRSLMCEPSNRNIPFVCISMHNNSSTDLAAAAAAL